MRFLLDEMFPTLTVGLLREQYGHEAAHLREVGLSGTDDGQVAEVARAEQRALVTENVMDLAAVADLVLVCVLKRNLAAGRAQAGALAELLGRWAASNPRPYLGQHWPH